MIHEDIIQYQKYHVNELLYICISFIKFKHFLA